MPKPRKLSGIQVVSIFERFGFRVIGQKGSHIKLRRMMDELKQTLVIPRHRELDAGTLTGIFSQALRYIPESELREHFYTE